MNPENYKRITEYKKWILNLYTDSFLFAQELKVFEDFLVGMIGDYFWSIRSVLGLDLYIQFLSVIHPFFLSNEKEKIEWACSMLMKNIRRISVLRWKVSPSLVFRPDPDGNVIFSHLLELLAENSDDLWECAESVGPMITLRRVFYGYPTEHHKSYKVYGADDLIGANVLEMNFLDVKRNTSVNIARIWYFLSEKYIFLSCIQNRKIGRLRYQVPVKGNPFEILLLKLLRHYPKKVAKFFTNVSHVWWIYDGFVWSYDYIGEKYGLKKEENIFWEDSDGRILSYWI